MTKAILASTSAPFVSFPGEDGKGKKLHLAALLKTLDPLRLQPGQGCVEQLWLVSRPEIPAKLMVLVWRERDAAGTVAVGLDIGVAPGSGYSICVGDGKSGYIPVPEGMVHYWRLDTSSATCRWQRGLGPNKGRATPEAERPTNIIKPYIGTPLHCVEIGEPWPFKKGREEG